MQDVNDHDLYEAGCKVRPYLATVVPELADGLDAQLSTLLSGAEIESMASVRAVFASDPRLAEWLLSLLDDPLGLPPDLQLRRAAPHVIVSSAEAVPAIQYRCPGTDGYYRYRRSASEPVGSCPDCGRELVP